MDLAIIIINYCTYDFTKNAIESIITKDHPFTYGIYVVDNASEDGSPEKLQEDFVKEAADGLIKFIINNKNKGFANANNKALTLVSSKYVLLINSDTIVVNNCLEKCMDYMKRHEDVGVLGCKVVLPDGKLDKACRRSFPSFSVSTYRMLGLSRLFPKSKRFARYNLTFLDEDETYEVDSLVGAFMLVRSEVVDQVGSLDEKFFMYGEDIDWCYRIKKAGWKIVYYPEAKIVHYKGTSSKSDRTKVTLEFYRSMYLFYEKHYKTKYPWIITAITYLGIGVLCGLNLLKNFLKCF